MKAALLGCILVGCKAESLGVEVPRGGPDAISVEDLQRDAFALQGPGGSREPGSPGHRAVVGHLGQRLQQMRMVPGFGRDWEMPLAGDGTLVCGQRDGKGEGSVVVLVRDPADGGASGPIDLAALISLAKAYDTTDRPAATVVLCGQFGGDVSPTLGSSPPVPVAERVGPVLVVSGFGSGKAPEWVDTPPLESGGPALSWRSQEREPTTTLDGVDYRVVAAEVRELHGELGRRMR